MRAGRHTLPNVNGNPHKPTLWQVVFGTCFLVALAAVPLYWSRNEEDLGNRICLCALGSLLLALAIWRVVAVARLSRARQR